MNRRRQIKALKEAVLQPMHPMWPAKTLLLIEVLVQADKIAIREGVDAHTKLVQAIDAALKFPSP
jgi:hypothetical protein